jgi:hypothetical protein
MDIVVPYQGKKTGKFLDPISAGLSLYSVSRLTAQGFHATTAETFADAIHQALSLSPAPQLAMRKAARALAVHKFSLEEFERGFGEGWRELKGMMGRARRARKEGDS